MSQATELIAEARKVLADAEKDLKTFEKQSENGITEFTDLAHLNICVIHGREFAAAVARHTNPIPIAEDLEAPVVEPEPEPEAGTPKEAAETETPVPESDAPETTGDQTGQPSENAEA